MKLAQRHQDTKFFINIILKLIVLYLFYLKIAGQMNKKKLLEIIHNGESSNIEFKTDSVHPASLGGLSPMRQ